MYHALHSGGRSPWVIAVGAVIILPPLIALWVLDVRVADERVQMTVAGHFRNRQGAGHRTGRGLIEELFFRGVLFTAIERESGRRLAIILPSLLYASVHFLGGRLHVPAEQIEWSSGFAVLGRIFIAYNDFAAIFDSFTALFAVGVLLALVRLRTGNIAACIGMHAAWVCALYYYGAVTELNTASEAQWLVGSYDGVIGWGTVIWMGVMTLIHLHRGPSPCWLDVGSRCTLSALLEILLLLERLDLDAHAQMGEALQRILHFQAALLLLQRQGQYFDQPRTHPRRIFVADTGVKS